MTTKKNTEYTDIKCNGKSACPWKKDESINNYYYDYHYTYDKPEKEPFFTITDRGRKVLDFIAIATIATISAWAIYAVTETHSAIQRIENTLDKKPVSVHTAPSINQPTK
jgi:hypothetical protein